MKINRVMKQMVRDWPKNKITKYDADITRAERPEVFARMAANGWALIADNEFFLKFAKLDKALGLMTTVCEYTD